jgi:hypothetical protein
MLFALIAGSASGAQATVPPSHCYNGTYLGLAAVVCEIDINDDGVLNGNDVKVIIPGKILSSNELNILTAKLDDVVVNVPITIGDITILKDVTVDVLKDFNIVILPDVVVVLPCGCPHQ